MENSRKGVSAAIAGCLRALISGLGFGVKIELGQNLLGCWYSSLSPTGGVNIFLNRLSKTQRYFLGGLDRNGGDAPTTL